MDIKRRLLVKNILFISAGLVNYNQLLRKKNKIVLSSQDGGLNTFSEKL